MMPNWLDSTLWSISCAYRRRKIRQSRVYADLMQDHPEIARFDYRISDKERAMLAEATKDQTILLAMQLHRAGKISDDALVAALDLDTPAILARGQAAEQALGRAHVHMTITPYQIAMLTEKLTDEAMMHGSWPPSGQAMEYWCEHCPQYGHCCICGQDHAGGVA